MKKKSSAGDDVELIKAVAQAWYAHSGNPRPSSRDVDDDGAGGGAGAGARRARGYRPSRFKLEAAAAAAAQSSSRRRSWDFAQSLWDTYELVTVAKKIESSLAIIDQATASPLPLPRPGAARGGGGGGGKWARESRRSLKSLFLRSSSRRFEESSS
ncbi:hypothetical protein BRADI_3g47646v3 [Brachypodium distachyon]|uniref:Uncharacterized protein n=2 Tax=Brachypodium distachyon TaxID=15368 RepID=A0A0Q3IHR3_BRADI|nr:hypothetical protein BRADI_3g47646v3 [Brachypodium distachyon]